MSVDTGRKVTVQVVMTQKLLDRVDAVAVVEAREGDRPNRSRALRGLLADGFAAREIETEEASDVQQA